MHKLVVDTKNHLIIDWKLKQSGLSCSCMEMSSKTVFKCYLEMFSFLSPTEVLNNNKNSIIK